MKNSAVKTIKKHLGNILHGVRQAMVLDPQRDYISPENGGFREDAKALAGDMRVVGNDLRKGLAKDGKAYSR